VLVDVAHAPYHLDLDVADISCYSTPSRATSYGPSCIGVLGMSKYASSQHAMPPFNGGGHQEIHDRCSRPQSITYGPPPHKFFEPVRSPIVPGDRPGAAIDYVNAQIVAVAPSRAH